MRGVRIVTEKISTWMKRVKYKRERRQGKDNWQELQPRTKYSEKVRNLRTSHNEQEVISSTNILYLTRTLVCRSLETQKIKRPSQTTKRTSLFRKVTSRERENLEVQKQMKSRYSELERTTMKQMTMTETMKPKNRKITNIILRALAKTVSTCLSNPETITFTLRM